MRSLLSCVWGGHLWANYSIGIFLMNKYTFHAYFWGIPIQYKCFSCGLPYNRVVWKMFKVGHHLISQWSPIIQCIIYNIYIYIYIYIYVYIYKVGFRGPIISQQFLIGSIYVADMLWRSCESLWMMYKFSTLTAYPIWYWCAKSNGQVNM